MTAPSTLTLYNVQTIQASDASRRPLFVRVQKDGRNYFVLQPEMKLLAPGSWLARLWFAVQKMLKYIVDDASAISTLKGAVKVETESEAYQKFVGTWTVANPRARIAELEANLSAQRSEVSRQTMLHDAQKRVADGRQATLDEKEKALLQLQTDKAEVQTKLDKKKAALQGAETAAATNLEVIGKRDQEITDLKTARGQLQEQVRTLGETSQKAAEAAKAKIEDLTRQIETLTTEKRLAVEDRDLQAGKAGRLEEERNKLDAKVRDLDTEISQVKTQNTSLLDANLALSKEITASHEALAKAEEEAPVGSPARANLGAALRLGTATRKKLIFNLEKISGLGGAPAAALASAELARLGDQVGTGLIVAGSDSK